MKKILKYLVPAALALLAAAACEDHRSDYMEEFQTMVYFRNGGEQSLALFRTGENGRYAIPVCKSGRNLEGVTSALILPFDPSQMAIYNIAYETDFFLLPSSCYRFVDAIGTPLPDQSKVELDFAATDAFKVVNLEVNTNAVSALQELNPDLNYVMAFELYSPGKVSNEINCIVLNPSVEIPKLSLLSPGVETHQYTGASQMSETYRNTVSLNMEQNDWDFTCTLEVMDEDWLEMYNNANGTSFELLPEGLYDLPVSELSFPKGVTEVPFDVTITREGMQMLREYALPVRIAACSKEEFEIEDGSDVYLLNVRLDPDQITLTADMVSVSHNQSNDGDGAPALVDGDITTYWHSPWSAAHEGDPVYGVYVDIALKTPLKAIVLRYCTRSQNGNGIPREVVIGVSDDGQTWTALDDLATEEMQTAGTANWVTLPPVSHTSTFRYVRLGIVVSAAGDLRGNNTNWTSLSELELFGTDI